VRRRVSVAVLLGCLLGGAGVGRADTGTARLSSNWSGYVATAAAGAAPLVVTDATGTWTVGRIRCRGRGGTSAAFWVGIGGASPGSTALEQVGSSADCSPSGAATYRAWIEVIPAPARYLSLTIRPGDRLTAAVSITGRLVTFSLKDATRGSRYSTRLAVAHALDTTSAEWIAEAPSLCVAPTLCTVVRLANFRRVRFSSLAMIAGRHPGTLTDPAWLVTPVVLATGAHASVLAGRRHHAGAVPGDIDAAGRSFAVTYRARLVLPPPPSPHADMPLPPWVH
jgi:hypothetical protein